MGFEARKEDKRYAVNNGAMAADDPNLDYGVRRDLE